MTRLLWELKTAERKSCWTTITKAAVILTQTCIRSGGTWELLSQTTRKPNRSP